MQPIRYVAFLRGINVGGHHKVPMAELRELVPTEGYEAVQTILNSGNILFSSSVKSTSDLALKWEELLEKYVGFPVPTIIRSAESILTLAKQEPFQSIPSTKRIRRYISFLPEEIDPGIQYPWTSEDGSFQIFAKQDLQVLSLLDLSVTQIPKGMEAIERMFGKRMTTRNWNTIERIVRKLR